MSTKASSAPSHPAVGTLIDGGSLELVEVLGVGGYGVVYRAIDARQASGPKSYAVKCLISSGHQSPRQRQIHIREIALHQLASAHPGVVTLHRVVEEGNHTFIVMDYAPDHDLFTQILHSCRYLGDDALIKDIFLQLLDAVEYCHALGIYHRDLKPENILCFDDGLRIAITDFGLATTDKLSDEFRTGSVYHMSPECQGGEFAPTGNYSPMFNDIWSLGIILLNLATGRNPWKSATPGDPTFQAYLRDPMNFLPSVLPISPEINEILVRMLEVDWRERMTLREVRYAIEDVTSFYSDGVVFEGSMARCPWESGMEIDSASSGTEEHEPQSPAAKSTCSDFPQDVVDAHRQFNSAWSKDSSSDIIFAAQSLAEGSSYGAPWTTRSSCGATWGALDTPAISSSSSEMDLFEATRTPGLTQSPGSSLPPTPNSFDTTFGARLHPADAKPEQRSAGFALMINTNLARPRIYDYENGDDPLEASFSSHTSMMHTAIEYDPYSSMFYINSPIVRSPGGDKTAIVMPDSAITAVGEDKEMTSPSVWTSSSATEMSSPSSYSESLASSTGSVHVPIEDFEFSRSASPSPEPNAESPWSLFTPIATHNNQVQSSPRQCQISSPISTSITDVVFPSSRLFDTRFDGRAIDDSSSSCTTLSPNNLHDHDRDRSSPSTPSEHTTISNRIHKHPLEHQLPRAKGSRPGRSSSKSLTRIALKYFHRTPPSTPSQTAYPPSSSALHSNTAILEPRQPHARNQASLETAEPSTWDAEQMGLGSLGDGFGSGSSSSFASGSRASSAYPSRRPTTARGRRNQEQADRHCAQYQRTSSPLRSPKFWFTSARRRDAVTVGVN